jgi:EAL domain-containing protein (putative c-di-GMP-specific phosphodiesterase class I)/GGDEF domain-containing protein
MPLWDEEARLNALRQFELLDGPFRDGFDRVTRTAAKLFDVPYAAVVITDADCHRFRSRIKLTVESVPRASLPGAQDSLLGHFVWIPDLLNSPFEQSELSATGIRFYAAAPLITSEGLSVGALCVFDHVPRSISTDDVEGLTDLASMLMAQIELHHSHSRVDINSGMPNRAQFIEDLEALSREFPNQRRLAAMIDLASPEQLITSIRVMGSGYLDAIVLEAAKRLRSVIGPDQKAYHVTGTQFAWLAPADMTAQEYRDRVADKLREVRATAKSRFVTTTTIGIAPFVLGRNKPLDTLRMAHNAAQDARLTDPRVAIYSSAHDAIHRRRFAILSAFGHALENTTELSLAYQPRIDLATGICRGAEAVLRWHSPTLGPVSPAEFMPFVEQSSMIRAATIRVLDMGLRQLAQWRADGLPLDLAVNVSAINLLEQDFADRLGEGLALNKVDPTWLEIEMTESAFIGDANLMLSVLKTIAGTGIRLAIDDFGTGYSSLSYLQRLPAKIVKIDQSFIRNLATDAGNRAVVRATVSLCHDLGYRVVAEGVETQEALDLIAEAGCDEAQGYLFAQPVPADAFLDWYQDWQRVRPSAPDAITLDAPTPLPTNHAPPKPLSQSLA